MALPSALLFQLCRSTAPVTFAPMPAASTLSKGANSLPVEDALQSLAPWWLSVDFPLGSSSNILRSVHSRADVAFIATDGRNRAAASAQHPDMEVHANVASFLRKHSAPGSAGRSLLGTDMHCGCLDRHSQLEWVHQSLRHVSDLWREFQLPYFVFSVPMHSSIVVGNVAGCATKLLLSWWRLDCTASNSLDYSNAVSALRIFLVRVHCSLSVRIADLIPSPVVGPGRFGNYIQPWLNTPNHCLLLSDWAIKPVQPGATGPCAARPVL